MTSPNSTELATFGYQDEDAIGTVPDPLLIATYGYFHREKVDIVVDTNHVEESKDLLLEQFRRPIN